MRSKKNDNGIEEIEATAHSLFPDIVKRKYTIDILGRQEENITGKNVNLICLLTFFTSCLEHAHKMLTSLLPYPSFPTQKRKKKIPRRKGRKNIFGRENTGICAPSPSQKIQEGRKGTGGIYGESLGKCEVG